jgi:hypothetical protein
METKENLKSEETTLAQEVLTDLTVDDKEQAAELKGGGAVAGIVIAATTDNNRIA